MKFYTIWIFFLLTSGIGNGGVIVLTLHGVRTYGPKASLPRSATSLEVNEHVVERTKQQSGHLERACKKWRSKHVIWWTSEGVHPWWADDRELLWERWSMGRRSEITKERRRLETNTGQPRGGITMRGGI